MSPAMSSGIKMFEAHNIKSSDGQEVQVLVEGSKESVKAFHKLVQPGLNKVMIVRG
jgi:hypothetical protein